jgi:hypothetical protein
MAAHPGAEFIASYFGPFSTMPIYLSSLPNAEDKDTEPSERHIITRNSEQIAAFVTKWDRPRRGVYFAVSPIARTATRRAKENVAELVGLHADIDFKDTVETPEEIERLLGQLRMLPTKVNHSGHGLHVFYGFHEAVPATPESIADIEQLLRMLADHLGGDPSVCEVARLMRLPGTTNSKFGDSLIVRTISDRPLRYDPAELREWLEEAQPIIHRKEPSTKPNGQSADNPFEAFAREHAGEAPIDVEARLASMRHHGPGESSIHATQLQCSAAMLSRGVPVDEVVDTLLDATRAAAGEEGDRWNWDREERDIRDMCVAWITKHPEINAQEPQEKSQSAIATWWHGDVDMAASRKYLVKNLIPEAGNGLLSGQWGTYKTFVALDLAGAVMTGGTFTGFPVKRKGGVLFIAVEGRSEIPIRLEAINRVKLGSVERLPFACLEEIPRLLDRGATQKIAAAANSIAAEMQKRFGLPLVLIVIDTVAAAAGYQKAGDENDAAVAQRVMNVLGEISKLTGTFCIAADHFGKDISTGTRGSSAKEGFADLVLALLGDKEIAGGVKNTRMTARKRRGGASGAEFAFTVKKVVMGTDEDGEATETLVIEWGDSTEPAATGPWPKSLKLLHRIIMALLADCGTDIRPFADGPVVRAIDEELVRAEFYKSYLADGDTEAKRAAARRKAFQRAVKDAQARNLVGVRVIDAVTFVWLPNPTRDEQ